MRLLFVFDFVLLRIEYTGNIRGIKIKNKHCLFILFSW
jgi:hypothetical protein